MKPQLFLDFDGVVNSARYFGTPMQQSRCTSHARQIDPIAVGLLNAAFDRCQFEVVISSSWRVLGLDNCSSWLAERGFLGRVIGSTSYSLSASELTYGAKTTICDSDCRRGLEIQYWLDEQTEKPVSFAIIDDSSDMGPLRDRLVQTTWELGIQAEHVERILELLRTPVDWPETGYR